MLGAGMGQGLELDQVWRLSVLVDCSQLALQWAATPLPAGIFFCIPDTYINGCMGTNPKRSGHPHHCPLLAAMVSQCSISRISMKQLLGTQPSMACALTILHMACATTIVVKQELRLIAQ